MTLELSADDLDLLVESLSFSASAVRDAQGTPQHVRQQKLERIAAMVKKLRHSGAAAGA